MQTTGKPSLSRLKIAVIGGGQSAEHDVSLASAASVREALDTIRFSQLSVTISRDGDWSVDGRKMEFAEAVGLIQSCAAVFPVLHGRRGEDGTVAGMLDLAAVPYVGSGVRAGAIAMDKWITKLVAGAVGVKTAHGSLINRADSRIHRIESSAVVKPVTAGSSYGVSLVDDPKRLEAAIDEAFLFDDRVLVEERLIGREVDIAVLARPGGRRQVGAPLEIMDTVGVFDVESKYGGKAEFSIPAQLSPAIRSELEQAAIAVFDAVGCVGVARIDFFVTDTGIVLNEVNTMPGLTSNSQVPKMFAAAGITYPTLINMLVEDAIISFQ